MHHIQISVQLGRWWPVVTLSWQGNPHGMSGGDGSCLATTIIVCITTMGWWKKCPCETWGDFSVGSLLRTPNRHSFTFCIGTGLLLQRRPRHVGSNCITKNCIFLPETDISLCTEMCSSAQCAGHRAESVVDWPCSLDADRRSCFIWTSSQSTKGIDGDRLCDNGLWNASVVLDRCVELSRLQSAIGGFNKGAIPASRPRGHLCWAVVFSRGTGVWYCSRIRPQRLQCDSDRPLCFATRVQTPNSASEKWKIL